MFFRIQRPELEKILLELGFELRPGLGEVVFEHTHRFRPEMKIRVFTTIPENEEEVTARGSDAMRIVLSWEKDGVQLPLWWVKAYRTAKNEDFELFKKRLVKKIQKATDLANKMGTCDRCGAPTHSTGHCQVRECREIAKTEARAARIAEKSS